VVTTKNAEGENEDITEVVKPNTNEKAYIRLRIPMREQTMSEADNARPVPNSRRSGDEDDVEQKPATAVMDSDEEVKMVEEAQDDKALSIPARIGGTNYAVLVSNQYGQRQCRNEFINSIVKSTPDWFLDSNRQQEIGEHAEQMCEDNEAAYISKNCGEYEMPCFDYLINANDFD
jgi:hypothetical protein